MKKYVLEIGDREYKAEVKDMTTEYAEIDVDGTVYRVKLKEFGRPERKVPEVESIKPAAASKPVTTAPATGKPPSVTANPASSGHGQSENVKAPLPGLILEVKVNEGDTVKAGQDILVMEAMKMENLVQAPHDGTVAKFYVKKGDSVAEGDMLVVIRRSFMSKL
ncbi:MAG: biotin/lipoyl-binding protein [bacterium]|nr:biotin/lipoyl-binding protein [bacterium]